MINLKMICMTNLPSLKEARASKKFPEYVNEIRPSCYKKETMATRSKTESKGSIGSQKASNDIVSKDVT